MKNKYPNILSLTPHSKKELGDTGIYSIWHKNKPDYIYIGCAGRKNRHNSQRDFYKRWYSHLRLLCLNQHFSIILQRVVNKYGTDGLVFSIIEISETPESIESTHIKEFAKKYKLYNASEEVYYRTVNSPETRKKISLANKGRYKYGTHPFAKKVFVYNLDGSFNSKFECLTEASHKLGVHVAVISRYITKDNCHTTKNWIFLGREITEQEIKLLNHAKSQ